jgi:dTDP-L-rhamnose 4-epimerase
MARLLITGGAGFIGTHLAVSAAESGLQVRILDNLSPQVHGDEPGYAPPDGVEFLRGDVTARSDWQKAIEGVDTIVHLAAETGTAQSMYEIDRYYRINVQGTALLFDVLANADHAVRNIVLASSRSVYGEGAYVCEREQRRCFPQQRSPEQLARNQWDPVCPDCGGRVKATATRETDTLSPASIYAASKLAQEELVRVACRAQGIGHAILRLQNVFGQGQSLKNPYTGILSIFSTRIRRGLPLPIFEDGRESRDFIHVDDVAEVMLQCVLRPLADGTTLNVGSGLATSVLEAATLLCRVLGSPVEPHVTGEYRVGDIRHNFADIGALEAASGYRPRVSLEVGLRRFCEWVATQSPEEDRLDAASAELKQRRLMR